MGAALHEVRSPLLRQAMRFGMQSGASASITLGLPILLHEAFGVPVEHAVAAALVTAFVFNFVTMRLFVFRSDGGAGWELLRYVLAALAFRLLEYGLFLLLNRWLGLMYVASLGLILAISTVLKFGFYRSFVFRGGHTA